MATVIVAIIVFGLVGLIIGKGIYDKNTIRAVAVAIAHPAVADATHRNKFPYCD